MTDNEMNFDSIEAIDAYLDGENNQEQGEQQETQEMAPETVDDPNEQAAQSETEQNTGDQSANETHEAQNKPSKEDKKNYAFAELNRERKQFQKEAQENKKYRDIIEELAKASNSADVDTYIKGLRNRLDQFNAKKSGVSDEVYQQLQQQKRQIAQLQNQRNQELVKERVNSFNNALNSVKKEFGFNDDDVTDMFNNLEKMGYTVETLLATPSPDLLIRGALSNKIVERKIQKQKAKLSNVKVDDSKMQTNGQVKGLSEDEELQDEIARWTKQGYID